MILKALSVMLLISCSQATQLKYGTCVLMDLDALNTLAWTDEDGNVKLDTSLKFDNGKVSGGACFKPPSDMPELVVSWADLGAVLSFDFQNKTDAVELTWQLRYTPNNFFTNSSDMNLVTHEGSFPAAGHTDMAYTCNSQAPINSDVKVGNNTYKFQMTFTQAKWQAFNLKNGQYSPEVEDCDDDKSTAVPQTPEGPTSNKPTEHPTTDKSNPTDKTTEKPTTDKPTEKPTTEGPTEKPTSEGPTEKPTSEGPTEPTEKPTPEGPTSAPPTVPPTTAAPSADPEQNLNGTDNGTTCILLKGKFLFTVAYPKKDGTVGSVDVGVHDVTSTKGDCNGTMKTNQLKVEFFEGWDMVIEFGADKATTAMLTADDGDDTYWWQQLNLTYKYDDKLMPGLNASASGKSMTVSKTFDKQFTAAKSGSYKCNAETDIDLSDGAKLKVSDMQYQAFQKNTTGFPSDNLSECSDDSGTNSVVPIAVGAALAGLVVIVLIAYLIGRKRNRKGYESV